MENISQDIINRIHKLLNLKEGAEAVGSFAEAENAAAKLQNLLMKYNLDLQEVRKAKQEERFEMHDDWIYMGHKADKRESTWVTLLCAAIARNSMCRVSVHDWHIHIIGEKSNVQLILYICDQMIEKVRIAEKLAWKIHDASDEPEWKKEKRGTFRRGFYQGACHGIDARLRREREEMMEAHNPFAVMIVSQAKVVEDYWIEKYVKPWEDEMKKAREQQEEDEANGKKKKKTKAVKIREKKGISSTQGWRSGYDAGLEMQINKGVDRTPTKGNIDN